MKLFLAIGINLWLITSVIIPLCCWGMERNKDNSSIFVQATEGSFNHQALELLLEHSIDQSSVAFCGTPDNAFKSAVEKEGIAFVAIKNTIIPGNYVEATLAALQEYQITKIFSSVRMNIEMTLLRHKVALQSGEPLLHITSHPAALQQISKWKSSHPLVKEIPIAEGTAEAARKLAMGELEMSTAVIGPKNLTFLYPQLAIIEERIQDRQDNYTTFILAEVVKRSHPVAGDVVIAELDDLLHAQLSQ